MQAAVQLEKLQDIEAKSKYEVRPVGMKRLENEEKD
jgi:hypothetical protein